MFWFNAMAVSGIGRIQWLIGHRVGKRKQQSCNNFLVYTNKWNSNKLMRIIIRKLSNAIAQWLRYNFYKQVHFRPFDEAVDSLGALQQVQTT